MSRSGIRPLFSASRKESQMKMQSPTSSRRRRVVSAASALFVLAAALVFQSVTPSAVQAAGNQMDLHVVSATGGTGISSFKYIINVDNTGTTEQRVPSDGCSPENAGYPSTCSWTSMGVASSSPIYTQGDQSDFGPGGLFVPNGRYLISVLADGFKLDGVHFTVPLDGPVTVTMQPTQPDGLPDATIQAAVFEDISPVNGAPDLPAEHGLAGFTGVVRDTLGEVTTDVYGSPLCGTGVCLSYCYVVDGGVDIGIVLPLSGPCPNDPTGLQMTTDPRPTAGSSFGSPVPATAAIEGKVKVPNLGTNRFTLTVTPPNNTNFIQTTTLEGNHDWDAWIMEGATGLDTEFVVAGEPFPAIIFGYAPGGRNTMPAGSGTIKGVVDIYKVYVPSGGGLPIGGDIFGGLSGGKLAGPIANPWIALTDLDNGDTAVWVGQGDANGKFTIPNVPDGNYTLTWWDEPQDYILAIQNVTIANGETADLGVLPLTGWWTEYTGHVFNDTNRNGIMDWTDTNNDGCPQANEGETGVPNFGVVMRRRENSLMDRGSTAVSTDACGFYRMESAYPMTQWLVMEAYSDLYYTTGVTYQADNQPAPTTVVGAGVDVSTLPIIGLSGRLDWGVHSYSANGSDPADPQNGGIVGTVSYDTTRNELDPRYAAVEDWQPGVSGLGIELYAPIDCTFGNDGSPNVPCDAAEQYQLAADGSYAHGTLLNATTTETWERPGRNGDGICIPRDVEGNEITYKHDQQITKSSTDCLEAPLMGVQFQNGYSTVDGNYGFGDGCFGLDGDVPFGPPGIDPVTGECLNGKAPTALPGAADYLVRVVIPEDTTAAAKPLYKFTREEDINIGNGDPFTPQVPPPACAGALHIVDVANIGTDGFPGIVGDGTTGLPAGVQVDPSTPTDNPTFVDIAGSPYEGMAKPSCDTKLVPLANGKSIAPTFNVFTDVPLPGRFWGLIVDDLNFSSNPNQINFGEKAGVPFAPVGIYDYTNRLVYTAESDYSGLFDVLMPSTNRINCPTPSGVCANVYRFVGNDPGTPGQLNPNYRPEFRTIAAEFEAIPGSLIPADLAPTQLGVTVQLPGGQTTTVECAQSTTVPQLFSVSKPYVTPAPAGSSFTINGLGFGATKGTGSVTLDGTALATGTWNDTTIAATVPADFAVGPHQLLVTNDGGAATVNGLTFHVLGGSYNPTVYEVGVGKSYVTIQAAINAAESNNAADLVVVYPGQPDFGNVRINPRGAYFENLIVSTPVKLQGVGSGGFQGNTFVPGTIIDGSAFGGDSALIDAWYAKIDSLNWAGNQSVNDGAVVSIYARNALSFTATFPGSIDGFDIRGGDQQGFPNNLNQIGGGNNGLPANVVTQGGAVFANAYARSLQITNNVVESNGGAYGTIRIGTPDLNEPNHNEGVRIANNRIIANAGTNLAGGIGLFAGSDGYEVANNDICGNFSAEYGGGITAYGYSPGGRIHDNRLWFNRSYDEGGGIMIAGALPSNPAALSPGSGAVDIYNNLIQANLSNDDGGGLRFLMAGNFPMNVYNNMIVNNVSTHEGGGVGTNDTPNIRFYNNTVMKNVTTATAVTSNGQPAPAGLSTSKNSDLLQAMLTGSPTFSNPLLFNNIFWDNRAGTKTASLVSGIGAAGDPSPTINVWDLGVADDSGMLAPTSSVIQQNAGTHPYTTSATNSSADPNVLSPYDTAVSFVGWRTNPAFIGAILVSLDLPPELLGDYHIAATSPAANLGAALQALPLYQGTGNVDAPATDIDHQTRPSDGGFEAGADELIGTVPPPPFDELYFSTAGNANPPGIATTADDSNIYRWSGTAYSRTVDASAIGIPAGANIDGFARIDDTHFYVSFAGTTALPSPVFLAADEDVLFYSAGSWTAPFRGILNGLGGGGIFGGTPFDLDAISYVGNTLYFSTDNNNLPPGVTAAPGTTTGDDADIYRWNGGTSYTRVVDASTIGIPSIGATGPGNVNVDGLVFVDSTHFYMSFSTDTTLPVLGAVHDEDVVYYNAGAWSKYFDGTARGLGTSDALDVDAFSLGTTTALPPATEYAPTTPLRDNFNRANNVNLGASWIAQTPLPIVLRPGYRVNNSTLEIRSGATAPLLYRASPALVGKNQEAYVTLTDISNVASAQGLVLRSSGSSMLRVIYHKSNSTVTVETVGTSAIPVVTIPATFVNGNRLWAKVTGGQVTVYRNGIPIGSPIDVSAWSAANPDGQIGLWFAGTGNTLAGNARVDNFGGGTL